MTGDLRSHGHRRGELIHTTIESAFLTASTLLFTLLTLIALFLGVLFFRAS
jgi:hypothetical protein